MFTNEVQRLDTAKVDTIDVDLSLYNVKELLMLRSRIDHLLPPMKMQSMNMEEELVRQLMTVQALQSEVLDGGEEPNKKASVVNACASTLKALAALQIDIHTSERFKKIEGLLIKHIRLLPKEIAEKFIVDYSNLILEK